MRAGAGATLILALGIWASATDASETIWEGVVRVVDATTLAGLPDGPVLPLGGIDPPPPDARCGPTEKSLACRELAAQALRDVTAGQKLVCERNEAEVACYAGGIDVAEWLVRMGWATATDERLRAAERRAWAAREGVWYERERFAQTYEPPPSPYIPPPLPGEAAVQACATARENAFAQREYGNLMAIEAVEWLIKETRLRSERRNAADGDREVTAVDAKTRETLNTAQKLCGILGKASEGNGEQGTTFGEEIEVLERKVEHLADSARETCWKAAAGAARTSRVEDVMNMRQIARHTLLRTEWLGERLWQAKEQGDDEDARRILERARAVFESAERQCNALVKSERNCREIPKAESRGEFGRNADERLRLRTGGDGGTDLGRRCAEWWGVRGSRNRLLDPSAVSGRGAKPDRSDSGDPGRHVPRRGRKGGSGQLVDRRPVHGQAMQDNGRASARRNVHPHALHG